eukprot:3703799-Amphidinium_carterae.1
MEREKGFVNSKRGGVVSSSGHSDAATDGVLEIRHADGGGVRNLPTCSCRASSQVLVLSWLCEAVRIGLGPLCTCV